MDKSICVGIGKIIYANKKILICPGIGSCLVLALWNKRTGYGGMAHIFLPHMPQQEQNKDFPGKYADYAVRYLMTGMLKEQAACIEEIEAYEAGGACMFPFHAASVISNIGQMNIDAVEKALTAYNISVAFADLGGKAARTIEFDCAKGIMTVETKEKGRGFHE